MKSKVVVYILTLKKTLHFNVSHILILDIKLKWQGAFFMPEHVKMMHDAKRDELRVNKPILDEYQIEEYEQIMHQAMEFNFKVKLKVWEDGFIQEYTGMLRRLDELNKVIYLEIDDNNLIKKRFSDIVGIDQI